MKSVLSILALGFALTAGNAQAAAHAAAPAAAEGKTPQQTKMGMCNKEAEGKTGDERKKFMSSCLSAKKMSQQDKMKSCNATAKADAKKGDERKAFMKECLSK
jgi:psiF repeat